MLWNLIIPPILTPFTLTRFFQQSFSSKEVVFKKSWTSLSNISPFITQAVTASEDQEFYQHAGFDFKAIKKVLKTNKASKRKKGASTISQQTAKNLFLWPGRDWVRKSFETYFTILIEAFWPKNRILEVYLNIIEFGNGIYGVAAASQYYFDKSPSSLSALESALLVATIPNPHIYSVKKPSPYVLKQQQWILKNMKRLNKTIQK